MSTSASTKPGWNAARLLTSAVLCIGGMAWGYFATVTASPGKQLLATSVGAYLGLGLATALLWLAGSDELIVFVMLPCVWPFWPFMIPSVRRRLQITAERGAAMSERQQFLASPRAQRALEQIRHAAAPGFPIPDGPEAVADAITRWLHPDEEILRCWLNAQRLGLWATSRGVYVENREGVWFFARGSGASASAIDNRAIVQDADGRRWAMIEYSETTGGGPIEFKSTSGDSATGWLPGSSTKQSGMAARAAAEVAQYLVPRDFGVVGIDTGHIPVKGAAAQAPEIVAKPGWYEDPAGRFELRWWSGRSWTESVARGGVQFVDPVVE